MLAERRRSSPRSMHRAQAQAQARALWPLASTRQERLRDLSGTPISPGTDSCALPTGPSLSLTLRARVPVQHLVEPSGPVRVRALSRSTHLGRSLDFTVTIVADVTATCMLTAPSRRSMLRTRAQ